MIVIYDPILLNNGGRISVQANEFAYCTPRDNLGPYTCWEIMALRCGFDADWAVLAPYADGDLDDWYFAGIYAYVPTAGLQQFIKSCGGVMAHPDGHPFFVQGD